MKFEEIRLALRDFMPLIGLKEQKSYYSNFKDEFISIKENDVEFFEEALKIYREKAKHYVKSKVKDDRIIN
ncbi:hypothetical protein HV819_08885 [Anaerococcus sp. AGMB00486]|uniref:Uncharacterized protein n=2 Tax=Anaerococcus TaxID=165779 RepID=A0ABX2NBQ4_9FIRM|nr:MULTISPECIES: hypothetical protein [Anaerococcus]MDY3006639.1 hypothetical protein [Anaerococcus porci]MSS78106.1 hypothetical protein [Anaerococcus porci]NVF12090.1 hypothetical protein [Anaerococcus faecalis]